MEAGFTITKQGWKLLAKLLAGDKLEISKIMVGSGKVPEGTNPGEITELVQPVALATSTIPQVEDKQVSFIVEYRSDLNNGLKEGFWLNEFGVYANDPDEGEILLYYATMGDYPQYVAAYNGQAVDVRRYPVVIAISDSFDIQLAYPANTFMSFEDMVVFCNHTLRSAINGQALEVIIPTKGWANSTELGEVYPWQLDIALTGITKEMKPQLVVWPSSLPTALACGLASVMQTLSGVVRIYATAVPGQEIAASLYLSTGLAQIDCITDRGEIGDNGGNGRIELADIAPLIASSEETVAMLDSVLADK